MKRERHASRALAVVAALLAVIILAVLALGTHPQGNIGRVVPHGLAGGVALSVAARFGWDRRVAVLTTTGFVALASMAFGTYVLVAEPIPFGECGTPIEELGNRACRRGAAARWAGAAAATGVVLAAAAVATTTARAGRAPSRATTPGDLGQPGTSHRQAPHGSLSCTTTFGDGHQPLRPSIGGRSVNTIPSTRPLPAAESSPAAVESITKVYGEGDAAVVALDDVTVTFRAQTFTAIMGPSGSGKSTLLHCAAGLDRPTSGRVQIDGTDITALDDRALTLLRRDRVGFVFQAYNLIPTLTAEENIALPAALAGATPDRAWVDAIIGKLGLTNRLLHRPSQMSGGQQQRVAIARALATRPRLLFADEPTGNLDSHAGKDILAFLRRSVDELGQTIVMVTHDPAAAVYADSVLFLADGRVVDELASPTADRIFDRLKNLED